LWIFGESVEIRGFERALFRDGRPALLAVLEILNLAQALFRFFARLVRPT
jgi:hypothetical protein